MNIRRASHRRLEALQQGGYSGDRQRHLHTCRIPVSDAVELGGVLRTIEAAVYANR